MIDWLLVPQNAAIMNFVGLAVGAIGLVLALWGIKIALGQLAAIKTETEASMAAIKSVQFKVASLDVAKECQAAGAEITAIRGALRDDRWENMLTSYEVLIEIFLRFSHASHVINDSERAMVTKMTEDMANICSGLRKNIASPASARTLKGQDQALRSFSDVVAKISFNAAKGLQQ